MRGYSTPEYGARETICCMFTYIQLGVSLQALRVLIRSKKGLWVYHSLSRLVGRIAVDQ